MTNLNVKTEADNMDLPGDVSMKLWEEGAVLVVLDAPRGSCFGIDFKSWNTEADFRGFKMIPPGLHYVHYSSCDVEHGGSAPRIGFMYNFQPKELVVRIWNEKDEELSDEAVTQETKDRLRANLCNVDKYLAPYPYEIFNKWKSLSSHITDDIMQQLTPESGQIRSALDLISCSNANRPKGKIKSPSKTTQNSHSNEISDASEVPTKKISDTDDTSENTILDNVELKNDSSTNSCSVEDSSTKDATNLKRRSGLLTVEQREEELLPHLKPAPGSEIRFSTFPEKMYPPNSTPAEITKHHLDKTYVMDVIINRYTSPMDILGELEFAYLCFLIGHSLDAFESWKKILHLFCSCEAAIIKYRSLYSQFINTLERQLIEIPEEFLADIVMNENFVYVSLRNFFRTSLNSRIEPKLKTAIERFQYSLTEKFMWNFSNLDIEEDDELPVVVHLDEC